MGNQLTCMVSSKSVKNSHAKSRSSSRRAKVEQELEQQALAFALYNQQHKSRVGRAASQRFSEQQQHKKNFSRSRSSRPRSLSDLEFASHQFIATEDSDLSALSSKHFVLVHGGGYGAWCWYKTIALLEECGFVTSAIDLTGSGIESTDPSCITSLSHYSKPLSEFLDNLSADDKVILVGHDFGGACLSHAMENHPNKISKAVFVAAAMPSDSQRALDVFAPEVFVFPQLLASDDLLTKSQVFTYAKGQSSSPTALSFDKHAVKELFFNRSPAKDVALASVSLKPVPFAPVLEKLQLSSENYGSVRRFYVQTTEDNAMTPALQERLINLNPPERVFTLKGSDHSPFFSKPQSLHKVLVEIAQLR